MSLFSIKNKKIIVTGSTGVLGKAMSRHLAEEGATVIVLGRNAEKVNAFVGELTASGGKSLGIIADVTQESDLQKASTKIQNTYGTVDILINVAGGNMPGAVVRPDQTVADLSAEDVRKVMDLNYLGTFLPIKAFLPLMLPNDKGNIINISSMAASRPMTRVLGYASAKAAIDNLTKWMAVELNQKHGAGFRVNAVAPGFFLTEQNRTLLTEPDGKFTERGNQIIAHTPMGRFGKPEDLLGVLQWLCSDASLFVTGTVIPIDGGFSANSGV